MMIKMCARCKKPVPYPLRYCMDCKLQHDKEQRERQKIYSRKSNKKYDETKREPKMKKFYNSKQWRTLANAYMMSHSYQCERCGRIGTQVHHKIYISTEEGWNKRFDEDNLEALCTKCHNKEHGRFEPRENFPRKNF